jgi:membrane protease YdiL (CAAX protease family)
MPENVMSNTSFVVTAALFEGALAVIAISLGRALGILPLETFAWSFRDLGWGVLGTVPLMGMLLMYLKIPFRPFARILEILEATLLPMFRRCNLLELVGISFLAGLGEELLFRPIVQGGVSDWVGPPQGLTIGLVVAAVLFGLLHCITPTYALLAGLIGLYLGILWKVTGNLLVPITTHALYDFLTLTYLAKIHPGPRDESPSETNDDRD